VACFVNLIAKYMLMVLIVMKYNEIHVHIFCVIYVNILCNFKRNFCGVYAHEIVLLYFIYSEVAKYVIVSNISELFLKLYIFGPGGLCAVHLCINCLCCMQV